MIDFLLSSWILRNFFHCLSAPLLCTFILEHCSKLSSKLRRSVLCLKNTLHLPTFRKLRFVYNMTNDLRNNRELRAFVLSNVQLTGLKIGEGSYGSVEEVAISGAKCAAKKLHDFFRSEIPKASTQFVSECQLMSTLRHPHIVQFLGVYFFPGSQLPALVMERLQTNLHDLLDPEMDPRSPPEALKPFFPLSLKCSILHNVASGLDYLHEQKPPIIHRDLSARNVLLTSGMVAKIGDLGVARIVPRRRAAATMTTAPGAGIYMPPEALEADSKYHSKYDVSIDVFSFGVVSIFTLGQTFPCNLLAPTYPDDQGKIKGRTELERRDKYMQVIYSQLRQNHPLLQMIEKCLDFPENRPSTHEVLGLLAEARAEDGDGEVEMNKLELIQALNVQSKKQEDIQSHIEKLEEEVQLGTQELKRKEYQIETLRKQEVEKDELLQAKDREIALAQLRQNSKLNCIKKKTAPCKMSRGSAANDQQFVYFAPNGSDSVHRYEWSTNKWDSLLQSPYHDCGLVIIDSELTAVGGQRGACYTNKLYTLQQGQWVELYPPMNTERSQMATVSTSDGNYTFVIGGCGECLSAAVELFDVRNRKWYELPDLKHALEQPSATICGNQLYVIGGNGDGYSCSLQALQSNNEHTIEWRALPQLPVTGSTAATLLGHLVTFGGLRSRKLFTPEVNSIHLLVDDKWENIGSMCKVRNECFAVSSSPENVFIVGGLESNSVEECSVHQQ